MTCRRCGMIILLHSGALSDQFAKENGFCSNDCREVYEAQKQLDKNHAEGGR